MLKNFLNIALRNLKKHKAYSFINILGLSIGLGCSILIFLYIQDELSYDKYHKNAKQIYRLAFIENRGYKTVNYPITSGGIAPALLKEVPEVLNAVRFMRIFDPLVTYGEKQFNETRIFYADESVFDVFSFPMIKGDPETALKEPYSAVITEDMAKKYFGDEDPMGKVLTFNGKQDFKITGILKKVRQNSHFKPDLLASMATMEENISNEWRPSSCYTYLVLKKDYSPSTFEKMFPNFFKIHRSPGDQRNFYLQPLLRIHLSSHLEREIEPNSDIAYVYILSSVAIFVLIIACLNFMNLSTARSAHRAKEVGIRKAAGARRIHLIRQFLGESIFLTIAALILSLILIWIFLPVFNRLAGKELSLGLFSNGFMIIGLAGFVLFVGAAAGSYPAFFVSAFEPVHVLKGKLKAGLKGSSFRKVLVVIQFSLSIIMIVGTIAISRQLNFIQNKNLGFDKEQLVVIPISNREAQKAYPALKTELVRNSDILSISAGTNIPGQSINHDSFLPEGHAEKETIGHILVDYDYIKTLGLEIREGRDFSKEYRDDAAGAHLLNEEAAKMLGWASPVGKRLSPKGAVIGVVKNFHFLSKHQKIDPLVISLLPQSEYILSVIIKIRPDHIKETLDFLKDKWRAFVPGRPLNYYFLEEKYEALYRKEQKLSSLFNSFTGLAIFIACLGLFGLASYTAEQRTKEIGIRKVLGASVANLIRLLSLEFTKWVIVANVIAWPVAYYALRRWLQNFAYRTTIGLWTFVLAAALAFVIALLTVSFQAVKAALANPVESLRYE